MAVKSRTVRRDPYRLNETRPRIAGGVRRPSVLIADRAFARIRERARLERLLLQHDPDGSQQELSVRDMSLLRQIATEGAVTNQVPAIRRGAILLLGTTPTPENLELLTELAVSGEDVYVRSHALIALGRTGLKLAAALLRDALRSDERLERQAAETALRLLGARVGPAIVAAMRQGERDAEVRRALGHVLAALGPSRRVRRPRRRKSTPDGSRLAAK